MDLRFGWYEWMVRWKSLQCFEGSWFSMIVLEGSCLSKVKVGDVEPLQVPSSLSIVPSPLYHSLPTSSPRIRDKGSHRGRYANASPDQ